MKTNDPTHAKNQTLEQLSSELFEFTSPNSIKKSLHYVLFQYLGQSDLIPPDNFATLMQDFYFLIAFLHHAEEVQDSPEK